MKYMIAILTCLLIASSAFADVQSPMGKHSFAEILAASPRNNPFEESRRTVRSTANGCCKICTKGKACGDTCIAQDKQCHVGPGCACDG
jgi:hypothetical protein